MMRFAVRPIPVLRVDGHHDEVVGFTPSTVRIEDPDVAAAIGQTHHANLVRSANKDVRVSGSR